MTKLVTIWVRGHGNIKATHRSTMEITTDDYVTKRGDCIVACCSSESALSLRAINLEDLGVVTAIFVVGDLIDVVSGLGYRWVRLSNGRRIVFRRSAYLDDSTAMILANKSAKDLDRAIVNKLKVGEPAVVILIVDELEEVKESNA